MIPTSRLLLAAASAVVLPLTPGHLFAQEVLDFNAVADAELFERPGQDLGNGISGSLNTRFGTDRNEYIALRFDLGSLNPLIETATLALINFRAQTSGRVLNLYGILDDSVGGGTAGFTDDNWDESSVLFSTMPGLTYDGDTTTRGRVDSQLISLGSVTVTGTNDNEGQAFRFSDPSIALFLQSHADGVVSFLIETETNGTGQNRFASKEATVLESGTITGNPGDFAPSLLVTIPEPGTASLLGLAGVALLARRRR